MARSGTWYVSVMYSGITCSTGGLCNVVVAVTVVCTVEPCFIMVVGVTGRVSRDPPGACTTVRELINCTKAFFAHFLVDRTRKLQKSKSKSVKSENNSPFT